VKLVATKPQQSTASIGKKKTAFRIWFRKWCFLLWNSQTADIRKGISFVRVNHAAHRNTAVSAGGPDAEVRFRQNGEAVH
jgi:hypothetical protein